MSTVSYEPARLATEFSRIVVTELAPDELAVFDEAAAVWDRTGRVPPGSVGFGIDGALVTGAVLAAVTAAVTEATTAGADGALAWWRRRARRRRKPAAAPPPLSPQQARRVRAACREHAVTLGLAPELAETLADAVVGSIRVEGGTDADR